MQEHIGAMAFMRMVLQVRLLLYNILKMHKLRQGINAKA
jgi:hypothetical protein